MKRVNKLPSLRRRARDGHKGDYGRVLVVAGSRGMIGAAALAGRAALRGGAGLVTIATPRSCYPILAAQVTCCMTRPLHETPAGTLSDKAEREIAKLAADADALAVGPGFGRHAATTRLVHRLVRTIAKPMVLDADALNALAEDKSVLRKAPAPRILTPHPGEMARLLGDGAAADVQKARQKTAAAFAAGHGVVLLLKGRGTIVTDGKRLYVNKTGNPGMATGGAGDVLTGVIAGLLAQGLEPFEAAQLGAYVHGLAGDLAAAELGEVSLIATDVLDRLPQAVQRANGRTPNIKRRTLNVE